ncbi:MAG: aminoglycoside 6-adenylyltransferase [Anaerolineaceae bacterium]|nr:aminoglycoside 6-adenylyltransferase [Anaerolineaceae bacterium]
MISSLSLERKHILERISAWSAARPDIRALAVVGSGARVDDPADEWSDWDLLLLADEPQTYLNSEDWLGEISQPLVSMVERGEQGQIIERRVLFRGGVDVDFIILPTADLRTFSAEPLASILQRGICVLFDRDAVLTPQLVLVDKIPKIQPPASTEFSELINDFLFHTVWTAKKIKRGELWTAKSCCDGYMKERLLKMIEWYTACLSAWETQTWYSGRFLERWASPTIQQELNGIFAHYDADDLWLALDNTTRLFHLLGRQTARCMNYPYPEERAGELQTPLQWIKSL